MERSEGINRGLTSQALDKIHRSDGGRRTTIHEWMSTSGGRFARIGASCLSCFPGPGISRHPRNMLLGQRIQLWLCVLILGLGRGVPALPAAELARFSLNDGDRVLLIGDTFFEREVNYGH